MAPTAGGIRIRQDERGIDGVRAFDKEANRVALRDDGAWTARQPGGNDSGADGKHLFAPDAQRGAAGGQDLYCRAVRSRREASRFGDGRQDVLAVVDQEELLARVQMALEVGRRNR